MSFDRLARLYEPVEALVFGRELQRCRAAFLGKVADARRGLVFGEGDGRFMEAMLRSNRQITADCVESSRGMISRAGARLERSVPGWRDRVRFLEQDARLWRPPAESCDLIVTHFFLDCFTFTDATRLVRAIRGAARPGAAWLVADFRLPERGVRRWRAALWIAFLYRACRAVTGIGPGRVPDYALMLREAGFRLEEERLSQAGMLSSQIWRL